VPAIDRSATAWLIRPPIQFSRGYLIVAAPAVASKFVFEIKLTCRLV
jgi:hypothetical protein